MAVRLYEGEKKYTGGDAIEITANRVVNLLLRDEDNLLKLDENNYLYCDLQLEDGITPLTDFPVGVTTGRVLEIDGWVATGTLLCFKTTSGDYVTWIYGDDGKLYIDNGTGTFKQIYLKSEVDALFTQLRSEISTVGYTNNYNDLDNLPTLGTAAAYDVGLVSGTIPVIGSNGKLDGSIVPTVISSVYTVTTAIDLTTLSNATRGDYGIVTDESKTYILSQDPYSVQTNWVEMLSPAAGVTSVNTKTGTVTLTTSDITVGDTSHQYVTSAEKNTWNAKLGANDVATVALTGSYLNLTDTPSITGDSYVTQAQYDALPSSKLTDGYSYFIYTS